MKVELLYIEDCPNWEVTAARLGRVAAERGVEVRRRLVTIDDDHVALGFRGSPTVLVEGRDPFASAGAPFGLACRVFETPDGVAGSPTEDQLRALLAGGSRDGATDGARSFESEGRVPHAGDRGSG